MVQGLARPIPKLARLDTRLIGKIRIGMERDGDKRKAREMKGKRPRRSEGIRAMITPALLAKLRVRAAKEHRTLSAMIELLLERGVDKES